MPGGKKAPARSVRVDDLVQLVVRRDDLLEEIDLFLHQVLFSDQLLFVVLVFLDYVTCSLKHFEEADRLRFLLHLRISA